MFSCAFWQIPLLCYTMAIKPLLSFNLSAALCLVGIFGVIFLVIDGRINMPKEGL